jgi:hypothetical protein
MGDIASFNGWSSGISHVRLEEFATSSADKYSSPECKNSEDVLCLQNTQLNDEYNTLAHTPADVRYQYSLTLYNRELLKTFNYLVGIGFMLGYLYVNKSVAPIKL